jgi:hypothetical protein
MKNMIVVADFFMDQDEVSIVDFILKHQNVIKSIYFNGEFYSVEKTLENFKK